MSERIAIQSARRAGRTTQQMLAARVGSYYVWPAASSIRYAKDLAQQLGRGDLKIVTIEQMIRIIRGQRVEVSIDHGVWVRHLTLNESEALRRIDSPYLTYHVILPRR